jgi:hypothetical protein
MDMGLPHRIDCRERKMVYSPLLEYFEKLIKWWNSHTIPYRIWYVSFTIIALVGGFLFKDSWRLSLGLLGIAILIVCMFGFPIAWYEKHHTKNKR